MFKKIILKNFKANLKNYLLFFISIILAVAELVAFWGLNDVMERAIRDESVLVYLRNDFAIAAGLMTFLTVFLLIFSMRYYIKLRIRDYSMFIVIGMKRKTFYFLFFIEYSMGCITSLILGIFLGTGLLYGIQHMLAGKYPDMIQFTYMHSDVYRKAVLLTLCIMIIAFFLLMLWIYWKDADTLILNSDTNEKKLKSGWWGLLVLPGIGLLAYGEKFYQSSNEVDYAKAHMIWIVGLYMILVFGSAIVIKLIQKRKKFYMRHVLQLNQLTNRFQSNLLVIGLLLTIYFFSMTYIATEIASALPLDQYRENYPYDVLWMCQKKDQSFSKKIADKYDGKLTAYPMIRISTYWGAEHIGISESTYEEMSGESLQLNDQEILVAMEGEKSKNGKPVTDPEMIENYQRLCMGKYPESGYVGLFEENGIPFTISRIYSSNLIGQYSEDRWEENLIVFSDPFFEQQYQIISESKDEPSVLELFTFPSGKRDKAYQEIESYYEKEGVKESEIQTITKLLYGTDVFLEAIKMRHLFVLSSKIFLLVALFISAFFVTGIKTLSELELYQRKYEFLDCMGMKKKMQRKQIRFETQILSNIAEFVCLLMAVFYVISYKYSLDRQSTPLNDGFWIYWIPILLIFILINHLIQRLFSWYMIRRLGKGRK